MVFYRRAVIPLSLCLMKIFLSACLCVLSVQFESHIFFKYFSKLQKWTCKQALSIWPKIDKIHKSLRVFHDHKFNIDAAPVMVFRWIFLWLIVIRVTWPWGLLCYSILHCKCFSRRSNTTLLFSLFLLSFHRYYFCTDARCFTLHFHRTAIPSFLHKVHNRLHYLNSCGKLTIQMRQAQPSDSSGANFYPSPSTKQGHTRLETVAVATNLGTDSVRTKNTSHPRQAGRQSAGRFCLSVANKVPALGQLLLYGCIRLYEDNTIASAAHHNLPLLLVARLSHTKRVCLVIPPSTAGAVCRGAGTPLFCYGASPATSLVLCCQAGWFIFLQRSVE